MAPFAQPLQQARVAELVVHLRNRLEPYVLARSAAEKEAWVDKQRREAEELSEAAFGEAMLSTIG